MRRTRTISAFLVTLLLAGCEANSGSPDAGTGTDNAATGTASQSEPLKPAGFSLAQYKDKNPVLIVFGDNRDEFLADLSAVESDLENHQVVVIEVFDLSRAYPQAKLRGGTALSEQAASDLRDMYGASPTGLTLVLIGKDGKVVAREQGAIDPSTLLEKLP